MSGFMSSSTAMTICKADSAAGLALDALRAHAITPDIDADGRRFGWVALGDPLDTDGFELAAVDGRYSGFSFRLDTRKASKAVIRLQLAEAVREERVSGKKVGSKRKKELKEAITAKLTARAEFVPSVTDCIWDANKGRLLVGSTSAKAVQPVLEKMDNTYEEAAYMLGATPSKTFFKVILPELRPALLTGFGLAFARGIGEYGSVIYISGNSARHRTQVVSYVIMQKLSYIDYASATAIALVMLVISFLLLLFVNIVQVKQSQRTNLL